MPDHLILISKNSETENFRKIILRTFLQSKAYLNVLDNFGHSDSLASLVD